MIGTDRLLAQLAQTLQTGDVEQKQIALDRIGMMQDPYAFESARKALGDPEPDVRGEAAICLGTLRDARGEGELVRLARDDPDDRVRYYALMALEAFTSDSVRDVCIEALEKESNNARMKAARQLWKYDDDEVVESLKECVEEDPDANVRLHAADSLLFLYQLRGYPKDWLEFWRWAAEDEESTGVRRIAMNALEMEAEIR